MIVTWFIVIITRICGLNQCVSVFLIKGALKINISVLLKKGVIFFLKMSAFFFEKGSIFASKSVK